MVPVDGHWGCPLLGRNRGLEFSSVVRLYPTQQVDNSEDHDRR